ncbi:MAG: HDOD domain-containing protein [Neptuniibacter sp.]
MKYSDTLQEINQRLDKLGDLPVFSATVNRIQQISASDESDAMALAVAIMKDTSLSAKVLKVANSSAYNRNSKNISVISRAVVLIGFNSIKNICITLKLIETFHDDHPDLDVPGMMMRQFLSASLAKEFALRSNKKVDPEEAYISALMFGLGEILVACTLPDHYRRMLRMRSHQQKKWRLVQAEVLGTTFSDLGKEIALGWGYPQDVLNSMDHIDLSQIDKKSDFMSSLPSLSSGMIQQLLVQDTVNEQPFTHLLEALSDVSEIPFDEVGDITLQCFNNVAKVSRDYGLKSKSLVPKFIESGEPLRDEMIRQLAFLGQNEAELDTPEPVQSDQLESSMRKVEHSQKQLDYLNRLSELISSGNKIHEVFKLVIAALQDCGTFERSMLCLLGSGGDKLSVKIIEGHHIEELQSYFERSKNGKADDLFFRILNKRVTLLVNDLSEDGWNKRLPPNFVKRVNCQGFVLIPLTMGNRVIGMLYADKLKGSEGLSEEDFNLFNQFATQTRMALAYADSKAKR